MNWEAIADEWEELLRAYETPAETLERQKSVELYTFTPQKAAAAEHLRHARVQIKAQVAESKKARRKSKVAERKVKEDLRLKVKDRDNKNIVDVGKDANVDGRPGFGNDQEQSHRELAMEDPTPSRLLKVVADYTCHTLAEDKLRCLPRFGRAQKYRVLIESCLRHRVTVKSEDDPGGARV